MSFGKTEKYKKKGKVLQTQNSHQLIYSMQLFRGNAPRGVFMRFLHENPEDYRAKMRFLHFVCIAKRVTENVVNSNYLIKNSSFQKTTRRISPAISAGNRGSMTVEAAMVLPLFLLGVVTILSLVNMMKTHAETEMKLHKMAREAAVYGYAADQLMAGKEGDWIRLKRVYVLTPSVKGFGFHSLLVENHCSVHIFNGYDVTKGDVCEENTQYVYITKEGSVYHTKRSCMHINVSIRAVSGSRVSSLRNKDGKIFYPCSRCGKVSKSEQKVTTVFVTDYGVNYHLKVNCSDLKRTVQVVPISQTGGRPPCSDCEN